MNSAKSAKASLKTRHSIFSIPRSVSASCFFSAGMVVSSPACKARMLSAMWLISSSRKTLLTVRMTAARSMKILLDGFLLAAQLSLCSGTLVVIMLISRMARPAFAYHHALTESAKQFSCQQVVNVRFCRCRRTLVFLLPRQHDKKLLLRNICFLLYPLFR